LGVIDSLTKGFQSVHRHWWVLLVPILLDAFLWVGPHASVEQLAQGILRDLEADIRTLPSPPEEGADLGELLETVESEVIPRYNGFSALRVGILGVPSLMAWQGARFGSSSSYETLWITFLLMMDMPDLLVAVSDATFVRVPVWQISSGLVWLLTILSVTVAGIVIGSSYITSISRSLDEETAVDPFWQRMTKFGARFALFWVLRVVLLVAAGVPLGAIVLAMGALLPWLGYFLGMLVLSLLTWVSFYGVFIIAALAVNNVSIWRAIWNSFNVVLRNYWPTLGLFILINLIGGGLTILWQQLSTGSWLTFVGIVGNAYVGTGLVTASFLFYRDRYTRWQEMIAELLRQRQRMA
jgi:hypothetical protein